MNPMRKLLMVHTVLDFLTHFTYAFYGPKILNISIPGFDTHEITKGTKKLHICLFGCALR